MALSFAFGVISRIGVSTPDELRSWIDAGFSDEGCKIRKHFYWAYEAAACLKFDLVPWECLPPEILETHGFARKGVGSADVGVDGLSLDCSRALQAKWYGKKSKITYSHISTFYTTSSFIGAREKLLVRPTGVKFSRYQCYGRENHFTCATLDADEMFTLLSRALPGSKSAQESDPASENLIPVPIIEDLAATPVIDILAATPAIDILAATSIIDILAAVSAIEDPTATPAIENLAAVSAIEDPAATPAIENLAATPAIEDLAAVPVTESPTIKNSSPLFRLRGYQTKALELIKERLLESNRVICKLPCGAGKTLIEHMLLMESINRGEKPVILVPSMVLIGQHYDLLERQGIKAGYLRGGYIADGPVIICMMNSIDKLWFVPEMVVIDEGHHVLKAIDGQTKKEAYLDLCSKCGEKQVYFTATPISTGNIPVVSTIGFRELIDQKYLNDYCIWAPSFSEDQLAKELQTMAELVADNPSWGRILAFCNGVEDCKRFSENLGTLGINCDWFDGTYSLKQRKIILDKFSTGEVSCIVTVYTLSEGIDAPEADCCLFVQPRLSKINVTQCVGRVLRRGETNNISHVVLPPIHHGMTIGKFVKCLSDEDPVLRSSLEKPLFGGRVTICYPPSTIITNEAYLRCYDSLGTLLREDGAWDAKYELLQRFVAEHQRLPTRGDVYQGVKIGSWCDTQRQAYKGQSKSKITPERIQKLEAIPGWWWDAPDVWDAKYELLQRFVAEHQRLPTRGDVYQGVKIGNWCSNQRQAYKGQSKSKITPERIQKLEAIPGWWWDAPDVWDAKYELLQRFVAEHQRLPTRGDVFQGVKIGNWCDTQRQAYKGQSKSKMTPERIQKLEAIPGWWWDAPDMWSTNYELLQRFVAEHQRLPTRGDVYQGVKIGSWCSNQRNAYKGQGSRKITPERIQKLEAIPG